MELPKTAHIAYAMVIPVILEELYFVLPFFRQWRWF